MNPIRIAFLVILQGLMFAGFAAAQTEPDPQAFLNAKLANPLLTSSSGEQFAWYANWEAETFVDAYLAYGNVAWLEAAAAYFDHVIDLGVSLDPDGYPGVIGALIGEDLSDPTVTELYDAIVGDAIIGVHITRFAEVVMNRPELHAQFLTKAQDYIDLATEMVWEKWNRRGTYYQDTRAYGSYHTHPYAIDRADPSQWIAKPERLISENLNKHTKAGLVILRLYRLTGNPEYRDRVRQIFGRTKAMFRLFPDQNRVVWNFWMPHGPYDYSGNLLSSWVAVHPDRAFYQTAESAEYLEVYDSGLVFDQTDMQRIANTNLWMMDNGFVSADGTSSAGELWTGIVRLDPLLRDAYEAQLLAGSGTVNTVRRAFLYNVTDTIMGFTRLYVSDPGEIVVDPVLVQPGVELSMAMVVPDRLDRFTGEPVAISMTAQRAGTAQIDLLDGTGGFLAHLKTINTGAHSWLFTWDGTDPVLGELPHGDYQIRWTLHGETRTWPMVILDGEPPQPTLELILENLTPGQQWTPVLLEPDMIQPDGSLEVSFPEPVDFRIDVRPL